MIRQQHSQIGEIPFDISSNYNFVQDFLAYKIKMLCGVKMVSAMSKQNTTSPPVGFIHS